MTAAPVDGDLNQWLQWLEGLDPNHITPGLARVTEVGRRLDVLKPAPFVISIAGTNGKGSSAALLEASLLNAGHSVAVYTSPHLLRYNERLRLNGQDVKDAALCEAFAAVAGAQANTALSYFEFGTLAVFWLMKQAEIAVAVLEVGLGGRLDAVNAVDAHAVLITSIGLDHQDWLGNDRESIGYEKAGIMRRARPAICNDLAAPASIAAQAEACGAELISHGRDYSYSRAQDSWNWRGLGESLNELPCPAITGQIYTHNAAGVLALLVRLRKQLRWKSEDFKAALRLWAVPGRAQRLNIAGREVWLDVAHNREAADGLSATLRDNPPKGRSVAVLAALKGKPVAQIMTALAPVVDMWQLAGLPDTARGLRKHELVEFARASSLQWQAHDKVAQAWAEALAQTRPGDRLIVLGSFHTVQAVLEEINRKETHNG